MLQGNVSCRRLHRGCNGGGTPGTDPHPDCSFLATEDVCATLLRDDQHFLLAISSSISTSPKTTQIAHIQTFLGVAAICSTHLAARVIIVFTATPMVTVTWFSQKSASKGFWAKGARSSHMSLHFPPILERERDDLLKSSGPQELRVGRGLEDWLFVNNWWTIRI